jgi:Holliday junction resolvase RusA-like endonuclease
MRSITLEVKGQLLSKSNSRQFTSWGGTPRLIKSKKALEYIEASMWQLKSQLRDHVMFLQPVCIDITIWYESKRPDLDVSLIQDILEKADVYKNDRLVHEIHAYKKFDKEDPRLEVTISEI